MPKNNESGKSLLIRGGLNYLWEELKTLNRAKFKALLSIASGYIRMKRAESKRIQRNELFR